MQTIVLNQEINDDALYLVQSVVAAFPEETEFQININSFGGSVDSGFALYDYMRNTDRVFKTNIDGICHSAAILVLLAASSENRSCNPNSTAMIHLPYVPLKGDYNPEDLEKITEEMNNVKNRIAQVYADRTNLSFEDALSIMSQERVKDAKWLLEEGFVDKINIYINNMSKNIMLKIMNILKQSVEIKDTEGNVVFEVEKEPLEVGMEVSIEEGEFIIPEVGKVTIKEGVITEIEVVEPEEVIEPEVVENEENKDAALITDEVVEEEAEPQVDEEKEALKAEVEKLKAELQEKDIEIATKQEEIEKLTAEIEKLKAESEEQKVALEESLESIKELKNRVKSNYKPEKRVTNSFTDYKENFYKIMGK